MHIVIATPSYPPRVAGPSHYAKGLFDVWTKEGHKVEVLTFTDYLHLPSGVRHIAYFLAGVWAGRSADFVVALDAFSAAFPAVLASRLLRRKIMVRVSGDFIWEGYVERTGDLVTLREFYAKKHLPLKERVLFSLTRFTLCHADGLIFQNAWQRDIVSSAYGLSRVPSVLIQNSFPKITPYPKGQRKNFLWAGRPISLKNVARLREACRQAVAVDPSLSLDIYTDMPREQLFEKMKDAYALILPSLSDVNPNLLLEGLQFGKPFISTRETGIRDVTEGMGLFVDPKDTTAIANAMIELGRDAVYEQCLNRIMSRTSVRTYADIGAECIRFSKTL